MNNRNFIILFFVMIASCKQRELIDRNSRWFTDTAIKVTQDKKGFIFPSQIYLRTNFQNNSSGNVWFNTDGNFVLLKNCDLLGAPKNGFAVDFYNTKNKTRIYSIKYIDSNSRVTGPVFIYDKRGRLEHIFRYKSNHFDTVLYTRRSKNVLKDTYGIDIQIIHR